MEIDDIVKLANYTIDAIHTDLPLDEVPRGVAFTLAQSLHEQGYTGKGVKIAILDTGIDMMHPDLKDRIAFGYNITDDYGGDTNNFSDNYGHGTHCAGIIGAAQNGSGLVGMAPDAELLIYKVMDGQGTGIVIRVAQAIRLAVDQGAHIISMSLVTPGDSGWLSEAVKYAVSKNVLVVCASGNDGANIKDYPAAYPESVCVAAANIDYDGIAYFSNYNDEVDLAAPGYNITSTFLNGTYATFSGTSMAAPHAAGAAALLKQRWESVFKRTITEAELFAELVKNTGMLPDVSVQMQGHGKLLLQADAVIPSLEDITDRDAIIGLFVEGVFDTTEIWLNLVQKFEDTPNRYADFRYVGLAFRKLYIKILELKYGGA